MEPHALSALQCKVASEPQGSSLVLAEPHSSEPHLRTKKPPIGHDGGMPDLTALPSMPKACQRFLAPPPKPAQPEAAEAGQTQAADSGQPQAAQNYELKVEDTEDCPDEEMAADPGQHPAASSGQPPAAESGQPQAAEGLETVPENQALADMVPVTNPPQFWQDAKGRWYNAKGKKK